MKGLLIKDIKLMKNMRNSIIMILLISVAMGTYIPNPSFLIIYLSIIGSTFTSSTLSYDEFDNGYAFLFSLPVSRKSYVAEKYVLGLLLCGGGWLAGSVIAALSGAFKSTAPAAADSLLSALVLLPFPLLLLAVLLPLHFKYGGEKGKIMMVCVIGGLSALFFVGAKILEQLNLDLNAFLENLPDISIGTASAALIAAAAVILLLSSRISTAIVRKKEF